MPASRRRESAYDQLPGHQLTLRRAKRADLYGLLEYLRAHERGTAECLEGEQLPVAGLRRLLLWNEEVSESGRATGLWVLDAPTSAAIQGCALVYLPQSLEAIPLALGAQIAVALPRRLWGCGYALDAARTLQRLDDCDFHTEDLWEDSRIRRLGVHRSRLSTFIGLIPLAADAAPAPADADAARRTARSRHARLGDGEPKLHAFHFHPR